MTGHGHRNALPIPVTKTWQLEILRWFELSRVELPTIRRTFLKTLFHCSSENRKVRTARRGVSVNLFEDASPAILKLSSRGNFGAN